MLRSVLIGGLALLTVLPTLASAQDRYSERPPVVVSPDLSAPWVIQLGRTPGKIVRQRSAEPRQRVVTQQPRQQLRRVVRRNGQVVVQRMPDQIRTAAVQPMAVKPVQPQMDPIYLPREVSYPSKLKPGSLVVDTTNKFLYFVRGNGQARRYGIGVGKEGMTWTGTEIVSNKRIWPDWRPPAEMIARERKKGRILPAFMAGGESNPLGARALYLGSTLYRVHGTNAPWTIGTNNSSGCFRMRNEDVVELYEMVGVGAKVVVL